MLFPALWAAGICAAAAYAVSLIWLFVYRIKNGRVESKAFTLAAVVLPAVLFAAARILFSAD